MSDARYSIDPDLEERIAEEEREPGLYASPAVWARIMANRAEPDDNERRICERFYNEARRCEVCLGLMVVATGARHHTCAPTCERCWRPSTNCQCTRKAVA